MAVIDCACCNKLFYVIFQSFKTREKGHYWCCQSLWYTLFRIVPVSTQSFEKKMILSRGQNFFIVNLRLKNYAKALIDLQEHHQFQKKMGGKIETNSQGSSPWLLRNWCLPLYDNGTHEPSIISFDGDEIGRSIQNRIRFVSI